jgi:hypothetical protein
MDPKNDRTPAETPRPPETPPPPKKRFQLKRFQIEKLEERIAPKGHDKSVSGVGVGSSGFSSVSNY